MSEIESAWGRYPGYTIDLVPWRGRARVLHGDTIVAESDGAVVLEESDHQDQLYVPLADVAWDHFVESDHHTVCPFKGEADYWSLVAGDTGEENVAWTYREPFPEVAGIEGYVAFYADRLRVELLEPWDDGSTVAHPFPVWGSARELTELIDVTPDGDGRFRSPPHPDPPLGTFLDLPSERVPRLVVEGGHVLAQQLVAAGRAVPDQRVVWASATFTRAALFDSPIHVDVDVVRRGRTYSTVEARTSQDDKLRSIGLVLLDAGAADAYRSVVDPPDVPGPLDCPPHHFGVTGRDIRVVDGAYNHDPDDVGPPELHVWMRHRDGPDDPLLHAALLAQPITHYTIGASMRPHRGITEALAHVTLSTGPMAVEIAFHDDADVTEWLLYENPAIYAGRGHVQGQGRIFTESGRLVASYSIHAMVRAFDTDPRAVGGYSTAM